MLFGNIRIKKAQFVKYQTIKYLGAYELISMA